jgi:molybdopterin converting factor small subunit
MPSIKVVTEGGSYTIENETVENVADLLAAVQGILNIPSTANVAVNGAAATPETPLADGDEVSTTKPAGAKGV